MIWWFYQELIGYNRSKKILRDMIGYYASPKNTGCHPHRARKEHIGSSNNHAGITQKNWDNMGYEWVAFIAVFWHNGWIMGMWYDLYDLIGYVSPDMMILIDIGFASVEWPNISAQWITLWLCQNSYWKSPIYSGICPLKMVIFP